MAFLFLSLSLPLCVCVCVYYSVSSLLTRFFCCEGVRVRVERDFPHTLLPLSRSPSLVSSVVYPSLDLYMVVFDSGLSLPPWADIYPKVASGEFPFARVFLHAPGKTCF